MGAASLGVAPKAMEGHRPSMALWVHLRADRETGGEMEGPQA